MEAPLLTRRRVVAAGAAAPLAWLTGCSTPLPLAEVPARPDADAERLLLRSAEAHGLAAYRRIEDVNVRYEGEWRPLIDRVQPVLVDKAYRGSSEERLIPRAGIVAQAYQGLAGHKQVSWRRGEGTGAGRGQVAVWLNGQASTDADVLAASALVAEGYGLFLLGPLWLAERGLAVQAGAAERVDGRDCDVVEVWLRPGLGLAPLDRVALCIDRGTSLTRRLRFTLEGYPGTRGAVAEVDTFDHERRFGVVWPMRTYERVVHPLRLPAHDWRIAGIDVNRGYDASALAGPRFVGRGDAGCRALSAAHPGSTSPSWFAIRSRAVSKSARDAPATLAR
ncbi:MAG TPA: hypothetical protein VHM00_04490 [Caldimonas sp.]|jgi:hypothetical protein|nr:hypothetical protein [Caldimonas sp.]HEX2540323.1 hypothetical protein [Caldimonas sp.]